MKISVITVCYNEEKDIAKTIKSVLMQTSNRYEYIICDGFSADKTVTIANSFIGDFESKNIPYKVYSIKDGGIYFGMNNGIDRASGDYIVFINAGDIFADEYVLEKTLQYIDEEKKPIDIVYGDVVYIERGFVRRKYVGNHFDLCKGMTICHQATFVSTALMKQYKFDTKYRIAADYDFFIKAFLEKKSYLHIDLVIAYFRSGGVCNVTQTACVKEMFHIWDQYGFEYSSEKILRRAKKNDFILGLKMRIPKVLWDFWNTNLKHRTPYSREERRNVLSK